MPPLRSESSTTRRKKLALFIEDFGETEMVRPCSRCRKERIPCRVHVRSGKCAACHNSNSFNCDVRVTESEFDRLRREHLELREKIEAARVEAVAAQERASRAQEEAGAALSKEMRLRKQMDRLEGREAEAIAVKDRALEELQATELAELDWVLEPNPPSDHPELALQPLTWTLYEGLLDEFWEIPVIPP